MTSSITKTIHYCWFGGNPLPESAKQCISSWRKYLPEYEIKEWNDTNFPFAECRYAKEAYEARKFAFVSDYARFWILAHEGGLYFDVDVEVIRPMDQIIERGAFMGFEAPHPKQKKLMVAPGLGMGFPAHHPFLLEMLQIYSELTFLQQNGQLNLTTIVHLTSEVLRQYGLKEIDKLQQVSDVWIYPVEYFCPINYYTGKRNITTHTYSIHHYAATWVSPRKLLALKIKQKIYQLPFVPRLISKFKS